MKTVNMMSVTDARILNGCIQIQINNEYWFSISAEFSNHLIAQAEAQKPNQEYNNPLMFNKFGSVPYGATEGISQSIILPQSRQADHQLQSDIKATK